MEGEARSPDAAGCSAADDGAPKGSARRWPSRSCRFCPTERSNYLLCRYDPARAGLCDTDCCTGPLPPGRSSFPRTATRDAAPPRRPHPPHELRCACARLLCRAAATYLSSPSFPIISVRASVFRMYKVTPCSASPHSVLPSRSRTSRTRSTSSKHEVDALKRHRLRRSAEYRARTIKADLMYLGLKAATPASPPKFVDADRGRCKEAAHQMLNAMAARKGEGGGTHRGTPGEWIRGIRNEHAD